MKTSVILFVLTGIFFSCQQKQLYSEDSEIDLVKKLNEAANKGDWTIYRSLFHDTAAVYINNWYHQRFAPDQFVEHFKKHLTNVSDLKLAPGLKGYLVHAIRGENKSSLGAMWVFKTEKERDQYFNDDGKPTEAGKELQNKMMPVSDELAKLGTSTTRFTDWMVQ